MNELMTSIGQWAREVGKWWWGLVVGVVLGCVALVAFIDQFHRYWYWLVIVGVTIALAGSVRAYHRLRLATYAALLPRREIPPPGGGTPHVAPVEYQVNALRQIIAKLSQTMTDFGVQNLDNMLKNHQRTGTDGVYEPLHFIACEDGLARLAELGEITKIGNWRWRINQTGQTGEQSIGPRQVA
jgi:hypothetical protein